MNQSINPAETGLQYCYLQGRAAQCLRSNMHSTVLQAFRFSFSFSDLGWAWPRKRAPSQYTYVMNHGAKGMEKEIYWSIERTL
jgi:hypothetical protein